MKILIVDDSKIARENIRKELEQGGYEVVETESGEAALSMVNNFIPDLITMDMEMPGLNGHETTRCLRELLKGEKNRKGEVPIIMISDHNSGKAHMDGFKAGVTDFVEKPFEHGTLLELVNYLLKAEKTASFG